METAIGADVETREQPLSGIANSEMSWMWHQHFNDSSTSSCRYPAVQGTFAIKALGLHQIERYPGPTTQS